MARSTFKVLFYVNGSKENVKRDRLKEPDKTKYELYDILKTEVGRCGNWNVLIANLKRQGVDVRFKHKGQTNEIQGVVFTKNGYHFNGSKVDRRFSYSKIDAVLLRNRSKERMGLMPKGYGADMQMYRQTRPKANFSAVRWGYSTATLRSTTSPTRKRIRKWRKCFADFIGLINGNTNQKGTKGKAQYYFLRRYF